MICARCHQPIHPGQAYDEIDKDSPSGAGASLHIHAVCPRDRARLAALRDPRRRA